MPSRITAPKTATPMLERLDPTGKGARLDTRDASKVANTAPRIPTMVLARQPMRLFRPMLTLAIQPTMALMDSVEGRQCFVERSRRAACLERPFGHLLE
jgi:hypothetical protein